MDRTQKAGIVDEFRGSVGRAQSVILTEFRGFTVSEATELRAKFREQGVTFRVIKNTLAKLAIADSDLAVVTDHLVGPTAWAYSTEDPVAPAKVLMDFLKDLPEGHLIVKAGFLGGNTLDPAAVKALSSMPGKDEMRSKLLSVFNGMGTKFVRVLAARPVEFLNVLKARSNELEG